MVNTVSGRHESSERYAFALGIRLGVNVPVTAGQSFFPRLGVYGGYESLEANSGGANVDLEGAAGFARITVHAPYLFHVGTHAFVGIGPSLSQDATRQGSSALNQNRRTFLGASALVGGWF